MSVTRSTEFTKNVQKMRDEGYDKDETMMFSCPFCGHMTVHSHRWTKPFDCLDEGCSCPGYEADEKTMIFPNGETFVEGKDSPDIIELNEAFDQAWNGLI